MSAGSSLIKECSFCMGFYNLSKFTDFLSGLGIVLGPAGWESFKGL